MKNHYQVLAKVVKSAYIWTHHTYRKLATYIPHHIQSLLWFDDNSVKTIFTILKPSLTWLSMWNRRKETDLFPKKGIYIWIFWNPETRQREYISIRYEKLREIFKELEDISSLVEYHDRAIINRLQTYTHKEYHTHSNKNMIIEITWKDRPLLKALLPFKQSLYIKENLKGKDLLRLYQFLHGVSLEDSEHPMLYITNDELEETILLKDDFLI